MNSEDRIDEQEGNYTEWVLGEVATLLDDYNKAGINDTNGELVDVYYVGTGLTDAQINEVIIGDAVFIMGAIAFVGQCCCGC